MVPDIPTCVPTPPRKLFEGVCTPVALKCLAFVLATNTICVPVLVAETEFEASDDEMYVLFAPAVLVVVPETPMYVLFAPAVLVVVPETPIYVLFPPAELVVVDPETPMYVLFAPVLLIEPDVWISVRDNVFELPMIVTLAPVLPLILSVAARMAPAVGDPLAVKLNVPCNSIGDIMLVFPIRTMLFGVVPILTPPDAILPPVTLFPIFMVASAPVVPVTAHPISIGGPPNPKTLLLAPPMVIC